MVFLEVDGTHLDTGHRRGQPVGLAYSSQILEYNITLYTVRTLVRTAGLFIRKITNVTTVDFKACAPEQLVLPGIFQKLTNF